MKNLIMAIGVASYVLFMPFAVFAEGEAAAPVATEAVKGKLNPTGDAQKKAADTGYTKEAAEFLAKINAIEASAKTVAVWVNQAALKNLTQAASYYQKLHGTCVKTQSTASWLCREKTSPQLQDSLNKINTVASMITGAAIQDACSNFAKVAQLAQMGLTAYTAACSSARAACEAACTTVYNNLDRMVKMGDFGEVYCGEGMKDAATEANCKAHDANVLAASNFFKGTVQKDYQESDLQSVALKNKACTYEYASMILSAGAGIASMINSFKQGQQCDEDTNGTGAAVVAENAAEKCADAANAQLPECICLANPRTPGCANSYQKANESGDSRLTASGAEINPVAINGKDGLAGLGLGSDSNTIGENSAGGSSDSGGIGAPMGGGGGLSGFGGAGGGSGGKEEAAKKGLNTDILSGSGGGGGGGFGGYRGAASDSKYRAYLPGGAKDPAQGVAGQQAWTKEVTGQGGKSNWEKVRERYRDNKNTLLNN